MYHQVVYVSSSRDYDITNFVNDSLPAIRENNAKLDVSGILLFADGTFLQVLEGDKATVHALYDKIAGDNRHQGTKILMERETPRRSFPDWSMGWEQIDDDHPLARELQKVSSSKGVREHAGDVNATILTMVDQFFSANRG